MEPNTTKDASDASVAAALTRLGPLGVVAVVWIAIAVLFPTDEPGGVTSTGFDTAAQQTAAGPVGTAGSANRTPNGVAKGSDTPTVPGGQVRTQAQSRAGAFTPTEGVTGAAPLSAEAAAAAGQTRGGIPCAEGVRQLPISTYATACQVAFTGNNGGATARGVSAAEIIIVERTFPDTANSQAVAAVGEQAGAASEEEANMVWETWKAYFNEMYELYGRTVKWVRWESQFGNATNEAQSKGREEACLDADVVANEIGAFAVVGTRGSGVSGPFAECAAERQLMVLNGAAYFPEVFMAERHPYVWGVPMECERISYQVAEYIGKRLSHKNAKWAGDALLQNQERKFATYVPNNDEYQHCVNINENELKTKYDTVPVSRYNYTLDVSRFPDEAARGIVQFKADGATSLIMACDPISMIFLTQSATSQAYHPEWILLGVALQDTDNLGQLYDQEQADGHMFGMSQLGHITKVIGPDSEAGRLFNFVTGGETIPDGTDGGYASLVHAYNLLQEAGPGLTPAAIAEGALRIPEGGAPDFPYGLWSLRDGPDGTPGAGDHTVIDDSREIYWTSAYVSEETGLAGTFVETYGGRRFRNGEWPAEDPPIYPES